MKSIIAISFIALTANAWWKTGHYITARIAYDTLEEWNPAILERVEEVLGAISD